eukprot:CAMPEP_0172300494 /NCGR_PEP_ID=MMETSP1058-20130122/2575_1 /TAXON_ID=83371 /ORGANISM="Detonula confervacea, Strain CCMP 353" /LENGTH=226 /DNA_ID=CAMNT_0013010283 /DNA_START=112 /DNA_END=792 /DNA_ORIENTATION=-
MTVEDSPTSTTDDVDDAAEELSKSALRDNISKKGKNAYYYAHAHKATGPKWDGKIEPRLLGTSSSNLSTTSNNGVGDGVGGSTATAASSKAANAASSKAVLMAKSNITNYAFLDEKTKVKIYVNLAGVGNCQDENIALDFTERSLCLTIKNYVAPSIKVEVVKDPLLVLDTAPEEEAVEEKEGEDRCLSVGKLHGAIENATYRKKAEKIIITLKKKDVKAWSRVIA